MAVGVLCAVQGSAEAIIVQAVEQTGGRLSVTRRCADLDRAARGRRGRARAARRRLGRPRPARPRGDRRCCTGPGSASSASATPTRPWLGERLAALGADLVVDRAARRGLRGRSSSGRRSRSSAPRRTARRSRAWPDERTGPPSGARSRRGRVGSDGRAGPHDGRGERGRGARRGRAPDAARGRRHLRRERRAGGRHARRGTRARRSGTCGRAGHPRPDDARPAHPDDRPGPAGPVGHLPGGPVAGAAVVVARRRVDGRAGARRVDGDRLRLLPGAGRGAQLRHAGARAGTPPPSAPSRRPTWCWWSGAGDPVGIQRLVRGLGELTDLGLGSTRFVLVNRVRASVAGPHPAEAVDQALARYAGVTDAHLVPDDRPALDTALLEARTLREAAPGSPARRALAGVAARVDCTARRGSRRGAGRGDRARLTARRARASGRCVRDGHTGLVRIYLPASLDELDPASGPLSARRAHAVTPALRAMFPDEDDEGLEYAAQLAAADDSLGAARRAAGRPAAAVRRVGGRGRRRRCVAAARRRRRPERGRADPGGAAGRRHLRARRRARGGDRRRAGRRGRRGRRRSASTSGTCSGTTRPSWRAIPR